MGWKWVHPLGDLWEGASLVERELPWTREKEKGGREEKEKKEDKE